jgi:hypothetical protein
MVITLQRDRTNVNYALCLPEIDLTTIVFPSFLIQISNDDTSIIYIHALYRIFISIQVGRGPLLPISSKNTSIIEPDLYQFIIYFYSYFVLEAERLGSENKK